MNVFDERSLWGKSLSHAILLSGGNGEERQEAARAMAAALVCCGDEKKRPCGVCPHCRKVHGGIHPDVITVEGEGGKPINVAQVRALRADAYVRPNEAERKVYVLVDADKMNDSAQNAMLKLLEEGPAYAAFLLLAEHGGRLLNTVKSRCEVLRLEEQDAPEVSAEVEEAAKTLADYYAQGREADFFAAAVPCEKWEREDVSALLSRMIACFRDTLTAGNTGEEEKKRLLYGISTAEMLRRACEFNASPGHLCGWMAGALFRFGTGDEKQEGSAF